MLSQIVGYTCGIAKNASAVIVQWEDTGAEHEFLGALAAVLQDISVTRKQAVIK